MIKNRIKEYRARFDMKQEDLARITGVRRETIGNLEKGKYNPSLVLAWNIAKAFGVSIEEVVIISVFVLIPIDNICTVWYDVYKEVRYMNIDDWKSQIKRGTLEFGILLMISQEPCYGYEIISRLEKWPILSVKENTVYPLLRRLLKEEYLPPGRRQQRGCRPENIIRLQKRAENICSV